MDWLNSAGKKTVLFSHLYLNAIISPRLARDKHRENSKTDRVLAALTACAHVGNRSDGVGAVLLRSLKEETASLFECFPYVCPEPVLVKSSHLYINGAKRRVSLPARPCVPSHSSPTETPWFISQHSDLTYIICVCVFPERVLANDRVSIEADGHFYLNAIILPRQARDKHGENEALRPHRCDAVVAAVAVRRAEGVRCHRSVDDLPVNEACMQENDISFSTVSCGVPSLSWQTDRFLYMTCERIEAFPHRFRRALWPA